MRATFVVPASMKPAPRLRTSIGMKLLLEVLLAVFLHPIAVILAWINLLGRNDLSDGKKVLWAIVCVLWGIGPVLYMLLADGALW